MGDETDEGTNTKESIEETEIRICKERNIERKPSRHATIGDGDRFYVGMSDDGDEVTLSTDEMLDHVLVAGGLNAKWMLDAFVHNMSDGRGGAFVCCGDYSRSMLDAVPPFRIHDTAYIDIFCDTGHTVGINPLDMPSDSSDADRWEMATFVSSAMCNTIIHSGSKGVRRFLRTALYVLSWTNGTTLFDIPKLCADENARIRLIGAVGASSSTRRNALRGINDVSVSDYGRICKTIDRLHRDDKMRRMFGHETRSVDIEGIINSGASLVVASLRFGGGTGSEVAFNQFFAASCVVGMIGAAARHRAESVRSDRAITPLFVDNSSFVLPDGETRWMMDEMRGYGVPIVALTRHAMRLSGSRRDDLLACGKIIVGSYNDDESICGITHGAIKMADFDDADEEKENFLMTDDRGGHMMLHESDAVNDFCLFDDCNHKSSDVADAVINASRDRFTVSDGSIDEEMATHDDRVFGRDK